MSEDNLKQRLTDAMKAAMKERDKNRLSTIRMALSAIKKREIDDRVELDNEQAQAVIEKMLKQCRDAHNQYVEASREDLAAKEAADIAVLEDFMPEQLGDDEIDSLVEAAIVESGAQSPKDMGSVMKVLKPQLQGRADMGAVSQRAKARLSQI